MGNIPLGFLVFAIGMTLAFLLPAAIIWIMRIHKRRTCTAHTSATIVSWHYGTSDDLDHPVYAYEVDGIAHEVISHYSSTWFSKNHKTGDTVTLLYNPNKPESIFVPEEGRTQKILIAAFTAFAVFVALLFALLGWVNFR